MKNIDQFVVSSFGEEWDYYKQDNKENLISAFNQYFNIYNHFFVYEGGNKFIIWTTCIVPK